MKKSLTLTCLIFLIFNTAIASELKLATTTSTQGSGLLDVLIPAFEQDSGIKTKTFSVGTGTALRMGRQGKVDALLVHAPAAEKQFVSDGFGIMRTAVMKNNFIIAGPKSDPAKINGFQDVNKAFKQIHDTQQFFISRGDDSGTHKKEMSIWDTCKIMPYGDWYFETGVGMGASLKIANNKSGYLLIDRGTWLAKRDSTNLILLVEKDPALDNPYHVLAINPKKYKQTNLKAAKKLIAWLTSNRGQKIINKLRVNGEKLFTGTVK